MANAPVITACVQYRTSGTAQTIIDTSVAAVGGFMIVQLQHGTTASLATLTEAGWTELFPKNYSMGSRQISLWGKIKASTAETQLHISKSTSTNAAAMFTYGTGADAVANWVIGTKWARDGTTTYQLVTYGLPLTTTKANSLALAFSYEATNTAEGTAPVTTGTGWTNVAYLADANPNIEQLRVAKLVQVTAGATPQETDTYANVQVTNGAGIQIALPPIPTANVDPVAAFSAVATGMSVAVTNTSSDPDGTVASWDWNWGDGSAHSTGATPAAHTYSTSGTMTITLTVTDNLGSTNSVVHTVDVNVFGRDVKYVDGAGAVKSAKMYYFDGTTKRDLNLSNTVHSFVPMTVTRFLDFAHTGPWEAAHRGFSNTYPEETLYSYKGATDRGVMAIEISCQMSADGTWWAFHDAYLDRTVLAGNPSTTTLPIATMTDLQIAAYSNLGSTANQNSSQPARPVAKVVDIINLYYKTHVIVIEDKTYTHTAAMLNLMDSYGTSGRPASEIFIWKVTSSSGKATFYDLPHARGYKTWGYIFDNSMATEFPALATSPKSDMIGMDFNSSDATLSSAIALLKANGVKPTGHIISSVAQRDRLLALGMEGLMYSSAAAIRNASASGPNLFPSSLLGAVGAATDDGGSGLTLGFLFQSLQAGKSITGLRFWATAAGIVATPYVWLDSTKAQVATGPSVTCVAGWNTLTLTTPLTTTVDTYIAGVYQPSQKYTAKAGSAASNSAFAIAGSKGAYRYSTTPGLDPFAGGATDSWFGVDLVY